MSGSAAPQDTGGIRSAGRTLRILDEVGAAPTGLTARELSGRLGLSAATVYRLLAALQERDYLVCSRHRYLLGRAVDDLGRAVRAQLVATKEVRDILGALHEAARAPVYLTVFRGDDIAVAHVADSPAHPRIGQLHVGFAEAAHTTAFGKIMLAARDDGELGEYLLRHGAAALTARSITAWPALREQLDEVRAQQIAVEVEEYMPELACIAAPVRSAQGRTVGAVSLSTTAREFTSHAHEYERIARRGAWHVASAMRG